MQTRWSTIRASLGALALALTLAGCSAPAAPSATPGGAGSGAGAGQSATTPSQGSSGQQSGGTQQIKRGGIFNTFSSASWAGSDPAMGQNAYQSWYWFGTYMLRREPDTWKLNGDAIEKWEFSADGLTLTLHVRKGMKWQNKPPVNGRDVEAKDIVYTIKSITGAQYPDMPPLRFPRKSQLDDMEDISVADQYTVKVKMKYPTSTFLDGLAEYRSPITPDGIREHFGGRESLALPNPDRFLTAGPFTLEKFIDNTEATLTRYPEYWEKGPDGQSKPYLDGIKMLWINDVGTQRAAFIARQIDFLALSTSDARTQVLGSRPDTQVIEHAPSSCWYHITYNTKRKPFDDVRVRKALSLTLDPVATGQTVWGEHAGKPLWRYAGIIPWSFPESLSQEELAKLPLYESPKSQKTLDEAKRLMAEAGYADGFSFEFMSSTGSIADAMQMYVAQMTAVHPNLKIKQSPLDNAIQLERAAKGDFDARAYCFIHEPTAVAHAKTVYHSKGGRNAAQYADPQLDEMLDKAGQELDEKKRLQLLRDAQMRALENYTFIGATHNVTLAGFQPEVRGMRLGGGTAGLQIFSKELWFDR